MKRIVIATVIVGSLFVGVPLAAASSGIITSAIEQGTRATVTGSVAASSELRQSAYVVQVSSKICNVHELTSSYARTIGRGTAFNFSVPFTVSADLLPTDGSNVCLLVTGNLVDDYICQTILGQFTCPSVEVVAGTTFTVEPVPPPPPPNPPNPPNPPSPPNPPNPPTPKPVIKCEVPRLKGMTLSKARTSLTRVHCSLGSVSRPKHVKRHHTLHVVSQSARARTSHTNHFRVNVTLR